MTKKDKAIKCKITGPGGEILWEGTTGDLHRDARKMKRMDLNPNGPEATEWRKRVEKARAERLKE